MHLCSTCCVCMCVGDAHPPPAHVPLGLEVRVGTYIALWVHVWTARADVHVHRAECAHAGYPCVAVCSASGVYIHMMPEPVCSRMLCGCLVADMHSPWGPYLLLQLLIVLDLCFLCVSTSSSCQSKHQWPVWLSPNGMMDMGDLCYLGGWLRMAAGGPCLHRAAVHCFVLLDCGCAAS